MKKTRYTEEQIGFALRQAETGTPVGEVIRKMGISTQTFYRWKKQFGQMGVDEIRRLKQLEEENRKLISNNVDPVKHFLSRPLQSLKRGFFFRFLTWGLFLGLDDFGSFVI